MMKAATLIAAMFVLSACNEQQGQPADVDSLSFNVPKEQTAEFDLATEIPVATAACVASELQGPAALQSLRQKGYTAIKQYGTVKYAKVAPWKLGPYRAIMVGDPNDRLACSIEVQRNKGYTGMTLVGAALEAQGYRRSGGDSRAPKFAKDGNVLEVTGRLGQYDPLAIIDIRRLSPS